MNTIGVNDLGKSIQKKIDELSRKRKWYQSVEIGDLKTLPDSDIRASVRTDAVLKFIPQILEKSDKVLDVGCNAGFHSLIASEFCDEVVGIDVSEEFIEQAHFLKSIWDNEGRDVSNVSFKVGNVLEDFDTIETFDVIFLLKVIYHPGFVDGVHDFMDTIEKSKVRALLAQGHVTHPKYSTINGMTELFGRYKFETIVLENIPEYPIVLATRKGSKISEKVTPVRGVTRHLEYYTDYNTMNHSKCVTCMEKINNDLYDFNKYLELFERCFVEVGIMNGTLGTIMEVPLTSPQEITNFTKMLGINEHSNARVESAIEFFDLYEGHGERGFIDKRMYRDIAYWKTVTENKSKTWKSKIISGLRSSEKKQIMPFLQMYNNMKKIRNLVPQALSKSIQYSEWHPDDFPWSINYFGYLKKRDGSHRRMIMKYFGATTIDEIVVDFETINKNDLPTSILYLRNYFDLFYNEVKTASMK